jgi:acetyl-CoA acyltransferase
VELLAGVLRALTDRTGLDPGRVEDVVAGCVSQVGEQSLNVARQAVLGAGWPESVPAMTVDRQCGSSQQAAQIAATAVVAGVHDVVIACGVESMSRIPLGVAPMGEDWHGPAVRARYPEGLVGQGVSAELVAQRWKLSREELDAYAAQSHARAARTAAAGGFDGEIVPVVVHAEDGPLTVARDETVREATTVEGLAQLRPSFATDEMRERFPDLEWSITPGNSSPLTDGASAALVVEESVATALGLTPRARFHSFAVVGDDPLLMLTGPIAATHRLLARSGVDIAEIDAFEINEAFASVPLAWQAEFGVDPEKLNPRGGAIALGHPLGASGTRVLATMVNHLEATGGRYGLQSMCEGGGMANATLVERL